MKSTNLFIVFAFLLFSCQNRQDSFEKKDLSNTDFIYLEGKSFMHQKDTFFPLMLNYVITFRNIGGEIVVSPIKEYENPDSFENHTKEDVLYQLEGHFQLIEEMGFNSLRICFDRISQDENGKYFYRSKEEDGKYYIEKDYEQILEGLQQMLDIAAKKSLRVMLLIRFPSNSEELNNFTLRVLEHFQDNPTLFAYDFMNEPLYFDPEPERKKEDAVEIVSSWKKMMQKHAPNQLFTIGFSEPIEVFEWDPEILPVDFVAFHTYHSLRVKNETYWYSSYINKPWIIGETALPAENKSITYDAQTIFMRELYQYVRDCGGSGFGWWSFQDGTEGNFEALYTGMLTHEGETMTKDGKHRIVGTLKPFVKEISHFSQYIPKEKYRPVNYFNMLGYNNFRIKGLVLNQKTKKPIEGAVIRGWNEDWSIGMNTFTNEKGEFTLYCNDICTHFEISAPGMTKIKFNQHIQCHQIDKRNWDIDNLPNKKLEYQSIAPDLFYDDSAKTLFDFEPSLFDQAKFEGDLGVLYLNVL